MTRKCLRVANANPFQKRVIIVSGLLTGCALLKDFSYFGYQSVAVSMDPKQRYILTSCNKSLCVLFSASSQHCTDPSKTSTSKSVQIHLISLTEYEFHEPFLSDCISQYGLSNALCYRKIQSFSIRVQ